MNPRKRQAAEPLLPIRLPKQPRRTLKGFDGGAPSPNEFEGILARYRRVGRDTLELFVDTFKFALSMPVSTAISKQSEPSTPVNDEITSSSSMSDSSSVSTPRQTPAPDVVKVFSSDSDGSQDHVKSRPKEVSVRALNKSSDQKHTSVHNFITSQPDAFGKRRGDSSVASTSRTPSGSSTHDNFPLNDDTSLDSILMQSTPRERTKEIPSTDPSPAFLKANTGLSAKPTEVLTSGLKNIDLNGSTTENTSMQSSRDSTFFSSIQSLDPRETAMMVSQPLKETTTKKRRQVRHRSREHIYHKVHKANVRRNKSELREELKQELYRIKRQGGFSSGYKDFQGLLDYRWRLTNLNLEDVPPRPHPSSSLIVSKLPPSRVPPSPLLDEDDGKVAFLHRYIETAKATLSSPKPPGPFLPSYDQQQLSKRRKDEEIEQFLRPKIPDALPPKVNEEVNMLFRKRGMVAKFAREQVSDVDLSRLHPGQWLNDEIVNFYGALISSRSEEAIKKYGKGKAKAEGGGELLDVHYFSSFFWSKLTSDGYEKGRLAKWTKKVDIFSKDIILFPVNHSNSHWTAAAINFKKKRIESYDSMGMARDKVCMYLRTYLDAEHQNKKKAPFDFTGWVNWDGNATPQQENGFDCGVFTCHFLEAISRDQEEFAFRQRNMPYLRRRMVWEIGNTTLRSGRYD